MTDIARAFCFAIQNLKIMQGSPFNVGSKKLNFTKMELAKIIQKHVDCEIIEGKGSDSDQRDYVIDFNRINKIGFDCEVLLDDGISEAVESLKYLINTGEFENLKIFTKTSNRWLVKKNFNNWFNGFIASHLIEYFEKKNFLSLLHIIKK